MENYKKAGAVTTAALLALTTGCDPNQPPATPTPDNTPTATNAQPEGPDASQKETGEKMLSAIRSMLKNERIEKDAQSLKIITSDEKNPISLNETNKANLTLLRLRSLISINDPNLTGQQKSEARLFWNTLTEKNLEYWDQVTLARAYLEDTKTGQEAEIWHRVNERSVISKNYLKDVILPQIEKEAEKLFLKKETSVPGATLNLDKMLEVEKELLEKTPLPTPEASPTPFSDGGKKASLNITPRGSWSTGDPNITTTHAERAENSKQGEPAIWI